MFVTSAFHPCNVLKKHTCDVRFDSAVYWLMGKKLADGRIGGGKGWLWECSALAHARQPCVDRGGHRPCADCQRSLLPLHFLNCTGRFFFACVAYYSREDIKGFITNKLVTRSQNTLSKRKSSQLSFQFKVEAVCE